MRKKILALVMVVMIGLTSLGGAIFDSASVLAEPTSGGGGGEMSETEDTKKSGSNREIKTSIIGGGEFKDDGKGGGVYTILLMILNVLLAGIGALAVLGVTIAGIQYLTAGDNEQKVAKAKQRILNVVIGLALYAALWAILQWLIPGGVFGGAN